MRLLSCEIPTVKIHCDLRFQEPSYPDKRDPRGKTIVVVEELFLASNQMHLSPHATWLAAAGVG